MRWLLKTFASLILFLLLSLGVTRPVLAAPPANFQTTQVIGTGLDGPSGFEFAPDGRIFIIQRTGEVQIYKNGALLPNNFVVLPSIASGDRGLIGIAFDPNFTSNHYVYFYYTGLDKFNHLVRYDASTDVGTNPFVLYQTTYPSEQLHVGGTVRFGPDGKLYFAVGDNGYGPNAQDLSLPYGKILRINPDGTIPLDNPFVGQPGILPEIWAYGLRNPWRFQFDSATGNLYVGDVGADSWEEVDLIVKGGNYGWPNCEGKCTTYSTKYIDPLYTYPHQINGVYQSSAITMGPVYHSSMFPQDYQNKLFIGDYARGTIRTLTLDDQGNYVADTDFDMQAGSVVDMKIAPDGSMYYITYYPGAMYRVSYSTTNHTPVANASADTLKGLSPFTVNFSSTGTYDPDNDPITYHWDFGDGTISTEANPTKVYSKDGKYTIELTVSDGVNTAQARPIVIQVGCPPNLTVGQPVDGAMYHAGDTITVNASAIDCAGFDINDASLSTTIVFHHTTHIHPFLDNLPGRSNSFVVPTSGEPSPVTWFEIDVTATDTNGLSTTKAVNIYPYKSNMTFQTQPAGLQILLDGIPTSTTQTIQGVVGFQRELNVSGTPQEINGKWYVFDHWADGQPQRHVISTPATDTTYTAVFKETTEQQDPPLAYTVYDELLGGDWIDWSWDSTVDFTYPNSYTGSNAISWTANKGWAGFFIHRNELPLDTTNFSAITFALEPTQPGQEVEVQLYDDKDQPIGHPVNVANYNGEPTPGTYKVYTIPLTDLSATNTQINDIQLQNVTDTAQLPMYIDRLGFVAATTTPTPTQQPTATPTPTPAPTNAVANGSFETTGANWLAPWQLALTSPAVASISQDTTDKADGNASAKLAVTTTNANKWYVQLYQPNIALIASTPYTLSFSAKAAATRNIEVVLQQLNAPYTVYWSKTISLTTAWKTYTYTITPTTTDPNAFIGFNLANAKASVSLDAISVCQTTCLVPSGTPTPTQTPSITPTPTQMPTPTPTQPVTTSLTVVDEGLNPAWMDWSWNSSTNFTDTTKPYTGSQDLIWKPTSGYGGLLLHTDTPVNTALYDSFTFALQATATNQKVGVQFYDTNDQAIGSMVDLSKYGGDPVVGKYTVYTIPLADLGAAHTMIKDFHIMDLTGSVQPILYIDAVKLTGSGQSPTPTPTPQPSNPVTIYDDSMSTGWESWSWDSLLDFAITNPVYTGTNAISFTAQAAWAGLDFHTSTGVSTAGLTTLHFAAKASQSGQQYAVFLDDHNGNHLSNPISLDSFGGQPSSTGWTVYDIPLSALNGANTTISDMVIHEITGSSQPPLYVDEVKLQ